MYCKNSNHGKSYAEPGNVNIEVGRSNLEERALLRKEGMNAGSSRRLEGKCGQEVQSRERRFGPRSMARSRSGSVYGKRGSAEGCWC